jgi:hypothetical protein
VIIVTAMISVPVMIMIAPAMIAFPIPLIESFSVMAWSYPVRASIRRASPVPAVPLVVVARWIPIALHPKILGSRASGLYTNYPRGWRAPIRMPIDT